MLIDRINDDLKKAVLAKDAIKTSTLRMLKSAIDYAAIDKKKDARKDDAVIEIVARQIKQHKDSIAGFTKGGRDDLVEKEKSELEILTAYMPEQLSADELKELVAKTIAEVGAQGPQEMGKVMGALMGQVKGKADGTTVSRMVREALAPPKAEEKKENE